jgi:hypothetical protein
MKLRKTIEEEILRILSDSRPSLKLAVLSIAESIRNNPDKYGCLGFSPPPSLATATYDSSTYTPCQPWQVEEQEQNNYIEMLIDEANKLYTFLAERLLCDIVNENVSKQPILPTAALPAAAALPSEEGGVNDDKQN